jgi:hypothetical protein
MGWFSRLLGFEKRPGRSGPNPVIRAMEIATRAPDAFVDSADLYEEYPFEIVGESHHQDILLEIVTASDDPGPDWPYRGAQCRVSAVIVPEDDNADDPLAVRVEIGGRTVGRLGRDDALLYRQLLSAARTPAVAALIVGGWDRAAHGEVGPKPQGCFGVRLAFSLNEPNSIPSTRG